MKPIYLLIPSLFIFTTVFSQLPSTDIYLLKYEVKNGFMNFSKPQLLTADNNGGYNNQPYFIGNKLFITQSFIKDSLEQTEIVSLNLEKNFKIRMTDTKDSEYSPTACPNYKFFSVVRVEEDEHQHLWRLPINRRNSGKRLVEDIDNIGYHAWLDNENVALFLVNPNNEDNHELVVVNILDQERTELDIGIGRCLKVNSMGMLYYIHKESEEVWMMKSYNHKTKETKIISPILKGAEDFAVLDDGSLVNSYEGNLFRYKPEVDEEWKIVANLNPYLNGREISRMDIHEGKLVIVVK